MNALREMATLRLVAADVFLFVDGCKVNKLMIDALKNDTPMYTQAK